MRLDYRSFRKWLREQDPDELVGITSSTSDCPLATWIGRFTGLGVSVMCDGYVVYENGPEKLGPSWVVDFIENLDFSHFAETSVNAGEALEALERALAERESQ